MHDDGDVQLGAEIAQELASRGTDFIAAGDLRLSM